LQRLLRPLAVEPLAVQVNGPLVFPLRGLHVATGGVESPQVIAGVGQVELQTPVSNRKSPHALPKDTGACFLS